MINTTTIIILVLAVVAFILVWGLVKNLLKATIAAFFILLLGGVILIGTLYIDSVSLRSAASEEVDFKIVYENETITNLNINFKEKTVQRGQVNSSMQITADAKKLIQNRTITLSEFDTLVTQEDMDEILVMTNKEQIARKLSNNQNIQSLIIESFEDEKQIKEYLLFRTVTHLISENNNIELIKYAMKAKVETEPEFVTIKLINYIPNSLITRLI